MDAHAYDDLESDRRYKVGILLALGAGMMFGTYGVFFRLVEDATVWHILLYRVAAILVVATGYLVIRYGIENAISRIFSFGLGLGPVVVVGVAQISINIAFYRASVAAVMCILATTPIVAALLARVFLSERIKPQTAIGAILSVIGIGFIVSGGVVSGSLDGILLAIFGAVTYGGFHVLIRKSASKVDGAAIILQSSLISALGGGLGIYLTGDTFSVSVIDFTYIFLLGGFSMSGGFILYSIAAPRISAAELALFPSIENVLSPVYVWLVVNEVPTPQTLLGAPVVLVGMVIAAWVRKRKVPVRITGS